jgi:biotin carboxyl carrier protein
VTPLGIRVVVSPSGGRLRLLPPVRFADGFEVVVPGQPVAMLCLGADEVAVCAPVHGRVTSVLGLDGEPIRTGQPILVIQPEDV